MAPPPCAAPALRGLHGRLTRLHVTASYGGGRGRGRGDAGPPGGGLIWGPSGPIRGPPGDQSSPRPPPGKLILPGQGGSPMPSRSPPMPAKMAELPDELGDIPLETALPGTINTGTAAPAPNRYRPPAGFMNEKVAEDDTSKMDPQQMLNKLQAKAGKWHALAKLLPALYSKQFDTSMVSELTGLTPAEQNLWFVASTVYDSLQASGTMAPQALARFDRPEVGPSLLYPFRFLAAERRVEAAQYIIAGDLDIEDAEQLARAMKDYERRTPAEKAGFGPGPGDCLALKFMRDAQEMARDVAVMAQKIEEGLACAESESAREKLREAAAGPQGEGQGESGGADASMLVLRLSAEELGVRPLAVAGPLGGVTGGQVAAVPSTSQEGAFGMFSLVGAAASGSAWVALPQWPALAMARHPYALSVPELTAEPSILAGCKAKSDEDKRRLAGPGLLVADRWATPKLAEGATTAELVLADKLAPGDLSPTKYYLACRGDGGQVTVVTGSKAAAEPAGLQIVGELLFVARPPQRDAGAVAEAAGMLQL